MLSESAITRYSTLIGGLIVTKTDKRTTFGKLGKLVTKRKYSIVVAWLILLGIVLPFALDTAGVVSLQVGSAADKNLESVKADNIISAQFASSVANNSLVIVISTSNVSSLGTQQFIEQLTHDINSSSRISGIENFSDVYSLLIPALNQTNDGVYTILDNANLTYSLLYGVPVSYFNVWAGAFNETENQFISGLNQTAGGVYMALDNANMTYSLLYGVPATYLNVWSQTYQQTQDVGISNDAAYSQTAAILSQADPESFALYTSHLLDAFNATWVLSFQNPAMDTFTPVERASFAADQTNQQYISTFLAGNATAQDFATALTDTFSLNDFLTNTQDQNNAQLKDFAIEYTANSSEASVEFVTAAYNLGRTPALTGLTSLADDVIWNPQTYEMGQEFVPMFNEIAYNQSASILKDADPVSFEQYTSPLLDLFNASWCQTFQNSATRQYTPTQRALLISDAVDQQYVDAYLSDNSSIRDFSTALIGTFSLQDFLDNNQTQNNAMLQDFALTFMSNSSGLSSELVGAVYDLGQEPGETALRTLAGNIVWAPETYNSGQDFNTLVTSFVSPSKDVTLLSITFDESSDANLIAIRDIIAADLAQNPDGVSKAQVTGGNAIDYDFSQSTAHDLELILPVTIVLLLVATGLFFRSIVTPLVTLGAIGVALGISQVFILLVGTYVSNVDFTIPTILITIIIGVGTDYGIFVIARHREEMVKGLSVKDAIVKSVTWAGESIATSGATVIISFLALSVTSIVLLQTMGLVVGAGVIVALLVALTMVPAIVTILGERTFWPNSGERFKRYAEAALQRSKKRKGYFVRSGSFSVKHAKVLIVVAVLVTVPLLYVYLNTAPTYDFLGGAAGNLDSISASKLLSSSFGGGKLFPSYVVVTFSDPLISGASFNSAEMSSIQEISSSIAASNGISSVTGPTMPFGSAIDYARLNASATDDPTVATVLQGIGSDNKTALITIEFKDDPYSNQAIDEAKNLRASLHENFDTAQGVTSIYVGGTTGSTLDVKNLFTEQFNIVLPIVAIGVAVVLLIVLRSLILPLFAVISVLMSIVWTLAITGIVFQSAYNYGLLFITPLFLFVTLLGLGMDYNIFILTRIREESSKGQSLNDAIVHAIEQTGGIITAAAIILAGSLGALMLSSDLLLKEIGFAFSLSILVDALIVRTYLVPAVMSALGKWNWYNPLSRRRKEETDSELCNA